MAQRLLVVVNAAAGTADDDAVAAALAALRAEADVEVVATGSPEELDDLFAVDDDRRVVVVGGDGSLHAVARALSRAGRLRPDDPVGLIGRGTGNDLARAVGLPLEPVAAARAVLAGVPRPLDLLRDEEGGVVVNAVHAGVGASAGRRAHGLKDAIGPAAYPVGAAIAGLTDAGWELDVRVDGVPVVPPGTEGPARLLMVGICNGPTIGGGTPLAPGAVPDDGLADVVVCAATGPGARVAFGAALRAGTHVERDDVRLVRGREITVSGEPVELDADGEVREGRGSHAWRVEHHAWSLLVPSGVDPSA
ncbi:diacylglycerol kinase family protein [Geodermatophilus sp. YIM 151500]|uniref:diacylglycerol/lipid kinase family protein n=1 Tax=Geodermatophilus sp. YIM 151500 TaxID=2984531 RepID=UPI0021E47478|nr:diacylglycerol kinase family protein [Geodermatophilus sp. YIM 151500]MCV2490232.1 diacylglycerol kinase family protein [Geodermatophilus sp. YIM 151500]